MLLNQSQTLYLFPAKNQLDFQSAFQKPNRRHPDPRIYLHFGQQVLQGTGLGCVQAKAWFVFPPGSESLEFSLVASPGMCHSLPFQKSPRSWCSFFRKWSKIPVLSFSSSLPASGKTFSFHFKSFLSLHILCPCPVCPAQDAENSFHEDAFREDSQVLG